MTKLPRSLANLGLRPISDEEAEQLPPSDDPGEPTAAQLDELAEQVRQEQEHGHPALQDD